MTNWQIENCDFAVLRTPLLSEHMFELNTDVQNSFQAEQVKEGLSYLIEVTKNTKIVQAIEFASQSLAAQMKQLTTELSVDNLKLASSIYKYLTRMSTRSTPFGAFSGVMTVAVDQHTSIDASIDMDLFLRLDNRCLETIIEKSESAAIKQKNIELKLRKNNSLYQMGNELRFVTRHINDGVGDYKLDEVKVSEAIIHALKISENWTSVDQIAKQLFGLYPQASMDELVAFVFNLLENQLLESNLNIVVSSHNALQHFIQRAEVSKISHEIISPCLAIAKTLSSIKTIDQPNMKQDLEQVKTLLHEELGIEDSKYWLHVDAFRSNKKATLGQDKISPVVNSLQALAPMMWQPNKQLTEFITEFQRLYGDDTEVPLLEALDIDNGVPFGQKRGGRSPLLEGMLTGKQSFNRQLNWHAFDQFLTNKVVEARSEGQDILKLTHQELKKYSDVSQQPTKAFKTSVAVHGTFVQGESEQQSLFQLKSVAGPSALLFLGRFCCGDEVMADQCRHLADMEQQDDPDVIYAEVIHVSQAITANISCRPQLRDYEIIYGPCDSSATLDKQITCDDLYIKVVAGQIRLYSRRLNKQIKPRLASAHNTAGMNLPVYQFLHAMQGAEGWFTNIRINSILNSMPYLPEIRIDNLIISSRRWLLTATELQPLKECKTNEDKFDWVIQTIKERHLDTLIAIKEGDNILEFNLNNSMCVLLFANELIRRNGTVTLEASMTNRTDNNIKFQGKKFRHEVVIPVIADAGINRKKPTSAGNNKITGIKKAASLPSEQWKYLKIYTGEASADKLIAENLAPFANQLKTHGVIKHWHFIRYQDPNFHIRIRFKLKNANQVDLINQQLNPLLRKLYEQGLIQNVLEDTYLPEIQRYGGEAIVGTCEKLFHLNSVITSEVIASTFNHPNKDQLRWQWSLRLAWQLIMSTTDSLESMEQFYKKVGVAYDNEFGMNSITKKKLSDNYRNAMPAVAESLSLEFDSTLNPQILEEVFPQYQQTLSELKQLCEQHNRNLSAIVQSLVHMDCNRIFVINPRANEWILYQYMARYSRTVIARKFKPGIDLVAPFTTEKTMKFKQVNSR